jgi:hypothetical protein
MNGGLDPPDRQRRLKALFHERRHAAKIVPVPSKHRLQNRFAVVD